MKTLKDIWAYCAKRQNAIKEIPDVVDSLFLQGKLVAYREIQFFINEKCSEIDATKITLKDLLEMIRIIPCLCHEGFKSRGLTDPNCPRCNWIDEDTVEKVIAIVKKQEEGDEGIILKTKN
jgi:hypothetical protein